MSSPLYRQIADDLRVQIESGNLRSGQQLQTEIVLTERYGASRNTVREAIRLLITLGLVEARPGQGTFVAKKINPFVTTLAITSALTPPQGQDSPTQSSLAVLATEASTVSMSSGFTHLRSTTSTSMFSRCNCSAAARASWTITP